MSALHELPVASVGGDLPLALLEATGRYAGPLSWNIDREMPRAALWLESKFPLWAFSLVEDWAAGVFDHLGTVVFSRGDDAAQRLYYYLCELRSRKLVGGPEPLIFDAAHIARASSLARSVEAVRLLASRLGVNDVAIETAIVRRPARSEATPPGKRNCLLAGTPPPDRRLHAMIEGADWTAHGFTLAELWNGMDNEVPLPGTGDPCASLGQAIHASRSGPRAFGDRAASLEVAIEASRAERVVLWYSEEDEAEVWNLPSLQRKLAEMGIPVLVRARANWRADDGIGPSIAAFLSDLEMSA